jgi:hypothetical protein
MFWIIGGVVVVVLGLVWWWAGRHSTIRGSVTGRRIDEALQSPEAEEHTVRRLGSGNFFGPS